MSITILQFYCKKCSSLAITSQVQLRMAKYEVWQYRAESDNLNLKCQPYFYSCWFLVQPPSHFLSLSPYTFVFFFLFLFSSCLAVCLSDCISLSLSHSLVQRRGWSVKLLHSLHIKSDLFSLHIIFLCLSLSIFFPISAESLVDWKQISQSVQYILSPIQSDYFSLGVIVSLLFCPCECVCALVSVCIYFCLFCVAFSVCPIQ